MQCRHRFLVSVGVLRLQRLFGEGKHVFNVTRVLFKTVKQSNVFKKDLRSYKVGKLQF